MEAKLELMLLQDVSLQSLAAADDTARVSSLNQAISLTRETCDATLSCR